MKFNEQVFCKCGKGRSFLQCNDAKKHCEQYRREWIADLEKEGWQNVNVIKQSADKCNICK